MDFKKHEYRIIIASISFAFIGIIAMIFSHIINQNHPQSIYAFLMINIGGLFTIGGVYSLLSELFLKKHFAREIQTSIDAKLNEIEKDASIVEYGLSKIEKYYTKELLYNRIKNSKEVIMLVMRNNEFFQYYCPELVELINNNLILKLILFNPNSDALPVLNDRFYETDPSILRNTLYDNINNLIRTKIYLKLAVNRKNNLILHFFDRHPTYSAYIFDDEELWLIPYFYRKDKRPVPIFILKGKTKIKNNEIYKDIIGTLNESSIFDLNNEMA